MVELLKYDQIKDCNLRVPLVIESCLTFLLAEGLGSEGLFRVNGSIGIMEDCQERFNLGEGRELNNFMKSEFISPEDVASLLKLYLRGIPDKPLFTTLLQVDFISLIGEEDVRKRVSKYLKLIQRIPPLNRIVVKKLLFLLFQVSRNQEVNRMSTQALAIVFNMAGIFIDYTETGVELVEWLIEDYPFIYEVVDIRETTTTHFLRKLVLHSRNVCAMMNYLDYVISVDVDGFFMIWNKQNFLFHKSFSLFKGASVSAIVQDNLWILNEYIIYVIPMTLVLDGAKTADMMVEGCSRKIDLQFCSPSTITLLCVVNRGKEVWCAGEVLIRIKAGKFHPEELDSLKQGEKISVMKEIGNEVWILKQDSKELQVRSREGNVFNTVLLPGVPKDLCQVKDHVWLPGFYEEGCSCVIINHKSHQIEKILSLPEESGSHLAVHVGEVVCIVGSDSRISVWSTDNFTYLARIDGVHKKDIGVIHCVRWDGGGDGDGSSEGGYGNGWTIWLGLGRQIEIYFIKQNCVTAFEELGRVQHQLMVKKKREKEEEQLIYNMVVSSSLPRNTLIIPL
eukprot:TRINITY_DN30216_c0_g1_i1.p1 TRINITY_DN30216_c0_g1~~TRINITY_DN30216_c0_g1_i1.p1  ORF type:complete len:563 (-),score=91.17 TRINITY_DN30216_c0_g1_i1:105-1793(-)